MAKLSLALLGTFTAVYDERPLPHFRTKAVQALLIYLVCQPEVHSREALMTLFWPELLTKSAQGNLRHALYHLRQMIPTIRSENGEVSFVLADRQTIQVNPDGRFQLDITQFEALTDSQEVVEWQTAVSLYRDDFLSDFYLPDSPGFESWAQGRRADLRCRLLDTLTNLTNHRIDEENFEEAEHYARRQLAIDNLREEAHRQLMTVLARNGRRPAALTHYQDLYQLLQDELRIAPSSETETLVEAIRSDSLGRKVKGQTQGQKKKGPVPHNLPVQATPFIGRQAELSALEDLLADSQTRLVTIVGAGGMGKSRLALAVAERQLTRQNFAQGVFFVPLAGLDNSAGIGSAIVEAMQVRLEQGESQLLSYLRAKQILLVLDNFEHLLEGSSLMTRLLQAAPQLQILVTSRERLRLQGEQVYPIQGLAVNDMAVTDDARTLFLQTARRLQPDFEVTAENRPALNYIGRLTEGMPLALELAAAWVDLFTPAEIAAEIQRNLEFLESNLRDVPSRHRNMQAVFDASWQRLSPDEQQLLAQVTIFKSGFTRDAVTAVAQASLRDLAALVNKSLLTFDVVNGRYHIHELLRQYAAVKREEDDTLHDRHSTYYCSWVAAQVNSLSGPNQLSVARKVQVDMPNIRAALFHALQKDQFADIDAVLPALGEYYYVCGQYHEGINLFRHIHDGLSRQPDQAPFTLFWTSIRLAEFHGVLDQVDLAEPFLQQAKTCLQTPYFLKRDSKAERAYLYFEEGYRLLLPEPETAVQLFRQSQTLLEQSGHRVRSIHNLIGLTRAMRNVGDLELAWETAARSLSLAQTLEIPLLQIEARLLLAQLANRLGNHAEAEAELKEGIAQLRPYNNPQLLRLSLTYLTTVQIANGHFEAAMQSSRECHQMNVDRGNLRDQIQAKIWEAYSQLHWGHFEQCATLLQEAQSIMRDIPENMDLYGDLLLLSSRLALVQGDIVAARAQLQTSKNLISNNFLSQSSLLLGLGLIAALEGKAARAQQIIKQGIQVQLRQKTAVILAQLLAVTAYLYAVEGEAEQAVTLYALAQQQPLVAKSHWFAEVVGKRITAVAQTLSPDAVAAAQARGKALDMWKTAEKIHLEIAQ